MANFSIKSFLDTDSGPEVRRFAIKKSDAQSFQFVCEKLASIYGLNLENSNGFSVFWKDEEGDEIRVSSDDELTYAIKCCRDDILKLYLRKLKSNSSSRNDRQGEGHHHPGVVCDNCDTEIHGFRYKCMQCPDYDLCGNCEHEGLHSEHTMMRISSPFQPGFKTGWHFRPRRHWRHHCRHNQQKSENGNPEGKCPHGNESRRQRLGEALHPYHLISKMWSAFSGMPFDMNPENQGASCSNETNGASASNTGNNGADKSAESEMHDAFVAEDYLRDIGETVAAVLDPFGIDVQVDVEHNGVREHVNRQNSTTNNNNASAQPKDGTLDAETGVSTQTTEEIKANSATNSPINSNPMETNDWTHLEFTETDKTESVSADPMDSMPELLANVRITQEPVHPDPKIADAAATMAAMGFNNSHGWLTALLALNEGNIERVCDILTSLGQHNGPTQGFIEAFITLLNANGGDCAKVVAIMQSMKKQ